MAVDEATWVRVRAAYEDGRSSVAGLARVFGVSTSAIYKRAKAGAWSRGSAAASRGAPVAERRPAGRIDHGELIGRLFGAIDTKLARLEARLSQDGPVSSADSEREARELSNMIRSFEKVTAVAGDLDKRRGKRGKSGRDGAAEGDAARAADAERMRHEIAERLERLHRSGAFARGAGDADER